MSRRVRIDLRALGFFAEWDANAESLLYGRDSKLLIRDDVEGLLNCYTVSRAEQQRWLDRIIEERSFIVDSGEITPLEMMG